MSGIQPHQISGRISVIRLSDLLDIRPAGYPVKSASAASLEIRKRLQDNINLRVNKGPRGDCLMK
jgi:hypothetical protein